MQFGYRRACGKVAAGVTGSLRGHDAPFLLKKINFCPLAPIGSKLGASLARPAGKGVAGVFGTAGRGYSTFGARHARKDVFLKPVGGCQVHGGRSLWSKADSSIVGLWSGRFTSGLNQLIAKKIVSCRLFSAGIVLVAAAQLNTGNRADCDKLYAKPDSVETERKVLRRQSTLSPLNRKRWSLVLSIMAQDKLYYFVAAISSILSSLAASAQGRVIGMLFDTMGMNDFAQLQEPLKQLLGLFVAQSVLSFVSSVALAVAATAFGQKMRVLFYKSSLYKDIQKYDEGKTGELVHNLTQDIASLQTAIRTAFSTGISSVTSIISGSVYLYIASPKLAVCMFTVLPVMSSCAHLLGVLLRGLSEKIRKSTNGATAIANETFSCIRTVRAFGAEERELKRYSTKLEEVSQLKMVMALTAGAFYACIGLGINLITLLICGYGGQLVSTGELTRGGIAAVVTQVQILERSMARLSITSAQLIKAFRSSDHIFDAIHDVPRVNTSKGGLGLTLDPKKVEGEIEFEDVKFKYPSRPDVVVLDRFNLNIKPGEVVALVGQSGSGKSTISALLERFYDVNAGEILIDGVDIRDIRPHNLHEIVGIVSQEPVLFGTTIAENLRYGKPDAEKSEVEQAAKAANAHNFIQSFPDGYDTELGERGVLLSGGQKQRIAIARVILQDPSILILDEATSALDNESERIVQEALDQLMFTKKRTTIVIAHRLSTVRNADKIIVLEKGRILESGSHDELLSKGGVYSKLYSGNNEL